MTQTTDSATRPLAATGPSAPTQCALLTGQGRSAIAVIELWGARAEACLKAFFRPAVDRPMNSGQVRYGDWNNHSSESSDAGLGESIVVVPSDRERYEIHCHGGNAAIERIIDDLGALGVVRVSPHPLAGVPGKHSTDELLISEACEQLLACTTVKTAAIVMDQVRGSLVDWRDSAIKQLAGDVRNAQDIAAQDIAAQDIAAQAAEMVAAGRIGIRLSKPLDVVLAGPPNVGKSSLINAMVGYDRSIIMDFAGTTRDVLDAETVYDGWPLRLRDTAGLHASKQSIEQHGIQRALAAIQTADLILLVSQPGVRLDQHLFETVIDRLDHRVPVLNVVNKSDLATTTAAPNTPTPGPGSKSIATVATTGEGIPELLGETIATLVGALPPSGSPIPVNQRQLQWLTAIASQGDQPEQMLLTLRAG